RYPRRMPPPKACAAGAALRGGSFGDASLRVARTEKRSDSGGRRPAESDRRSIRGGIRRPIPAPRNSQRIDRADRKKGGSGAVPNEGRVAPVPPWRER